MSALRMPIPEIPKQALDIASRLELRFGLGTNPELRRALYQKLQQLVDGERGSEVLACLDSVVADAVGKSDPGRYFAKVSLARLCERGLMEERRYVDW